MTETKGRILVVDDEHSIRYTFALFLDESGYETTAVAAPDDALRALSDGEVDLAFVDILLENTSGIDLLGEIKRRSPSTEVVIVTGAPSIETASEALRLGAFDYLVKPVRQEALLRITDVALRHKSVREAAERYRMNLEAIFRSLQDGVVTVDRHLTTTEVNGAAERLCGLRRQEVLGKPLNGDLLCCGGECLEALRTTVALGRPVTLEHLECRTPRRPGQVVSVTATPLLKGDRQPSGGVLVIRDQTRLVELEQSLRRCQPGKLVGDSPAIRRIRATIRSLADFPTTVLITGESGTGKEVVADAIHAAGRRHPLVKVNCSALSEELLESELFGHVKGAFTGALRDRVGRFQLADGGTLFLDEIAEMPPRMQLRFLRVLETLEFERVGESQPIQVDVRVIAATNRELKERVARGLFREDLYFRLKVFEIHIPPLRERREDIPPLVQHLLHKLSVRLGKKVTAVSDSVLELFLHHPWPGNVRELEHGLEHAFVLVRGETITPRELPAEFRRAVRAQIASPSESPPGELENLRDALRRAGNNKTRAARLLGISRRTLYRRLERLHERGVDPVEKVSEEPSRNPM
jgi:two-component system response regulator HydG